jgi:hypothetical protein
LDARLAALADTDNLPDLGSNSWETNLLGQELPKLVTASAVRIDHGVFLFQLFKNGTVRIEKRLVDVFSN